MKDQYVKVTSMLLVFRALQAVLISPKLKEFGNGIINIGAAMSVIQTTLSNEWSLRFVLELHCT